MEYQEWNSFIKRLKWRQGEHVSIFGKTGCGKTTLSLAMLSKHDNVVLLLNKIRDPVLEHFIEVNDYQEIATWAKADVYEDNIALWPRFYGVESFDDQYDVFDEAINGSRQKKIKGIFREGGWTVYVDEVLYFVKQLGLQKQLDMLWTQGRSNDISVLASAQRPFFVPQNMLDQATHFFIFGYRDRRDINRLGDALGDNLDSIRRTVPKLHKFQFMYVNAETGQEVVSKVRKVRK